MEKVQFMPEGEDRPVDFYVVEEARLGGKHYLLVTDSEDGDGEALILRTVRKEKDAASADVVPAHSSPDPAKSRDSEEQMTYEIVEDEKEMSAVLLLMRDSLEELGIEIEE